MTNQDENVKEDKKINKDKTFFILLAGVTIGSYVAGFILWGQV